MCDERKKHYFPNNRENIKKRLSYSNIQIKCVHITSQKLCILLRTCAVPLPILFHNLDKCPAALVEYTISKQIKSMLVSKIGTGDYAKSTVGSFYKKISSFKLFRVLFGLSTTAHRQPHRTNCKTTSFYSPKRPQR